MLGKGLESLIPPHKRHDDSSHDDGHTPEDFTVHLEEQDGSSPTNTPVDNEGGSSDDHAPAPVEPALGPERELAAPKPHEDMPAIVPVEPKQGRHLHGVSKEHEEHSAQESSPVVAHEKKSPGTSTVHMTHHGAPHEPEPAHHRQVKMPDAIFHIETEKIVPNPDQPRRTFDETSIKELAASIREFGILQPLVVTKREREVSTGTEVEYALISGERRLLAAKKLGLPQVPVVIRNVSYDRERLELAVIENIQREDLNPIELARAYARLQDEFRMTQREVASRLGKSREAVANTIRLLDLAPKIQDALVEGAISESHGRLLLTIDDPGAQERLFRDLIENRLTTRELKHRVRRIAPRDATKGGRPSGLSPELKMLQERLSTELGTPVAIHQHGGTGRITISYYSPEELQHIVERLGSSEESD